MKEEALPRRRTLDGSSHSGDNSNHNRRSTTGGTDASGGGGSGARVQGDHNGRPVPAYSSVRNMPSVAAAAAAPAAAANMVKSSKGAAPAAAPAPAYTVPRQRDVRSVNPAVDDLAYFHTEEWPFAAEQHDREKENLLGVHRSVLEGKKDIPQLNEKSSGPIQPGVGGLGRVLKEWDVECALKHLDAVGPSVVSHDELHEFTLMEGESAEDVLDLAGLENAPGLLHNISQRCRLIFTNKKRLVFTQANHSAEVGVPTMHCCATLFHCFHDRWSKRKWSSFYAAINASEVIQVFVQQTLTTSYMATSCRGDEICDFEWCSVGGVMKSDKNIEQATQTLGDFDQGSCVRRWDKTRFMRHALVIRYLDCATNSIMQTIAMAHPDTPASKLYEMARSIEANITVKSADWLKCKQIPTPHPRSPFTYHHHSVPLFRKKSYRFLMFGLFFVAFIILFVDTGAGFAMIAAVALAIGGAYTSSETRGKTQEAGATGVQFSKTLIGTQGVGGFVYGGSLITVLFGE